MSNRKIMTILERRATLSLASIFSFRMLGLFMILPVFALYAEKLHGTTPVLVGLALGIYGLTQALLQIPFGMLSDRLGRKPIILTGLIIFVIGSVIAAKAHSIDGVILGRAVQGAGAVGSTIIALVADLTHEEHRTKAMAIIGMTIGLSFIVAMILGPLLNGWIGVPGIFWLTALLAVTGIAILYVAVPTPSRRIFHRDTEPVPTLLKTTLKNSELLRLNFGISVLHAILTASFLAIPFALQKMAGLQENHQWLLYLPVLILAFITMLPFIIIAEKKRRMKSILISAIATLALSQWFLWEFSYTTFGIGLGLFIFFTAFTLLEASLPSLVSKIAPAGSKGTAMGIYSSSQFFGIFIGGTLGGWILEHYHIKGIFIFSLVLALLWLCIAITMKKPPHWGTHLLKVGNLTVDQARNLSKQLMPIAGVIEAAVMVDDGIAYLKVDNKIVDKEALAHTVKQFLANVE